MNGTNGHGSSEEFQSTVKEVSDDLQEMGRELTKRANDVRKEVVKQLNNAAETIRKEAHDATDDTGARKTADEVAKGLEKAAHYLNNRSVEQMGTEASRVVRSNPLRTLFIAFAVGLLLGIVMRGDKK